MTIIFLILASAWAFGSLSIFEDIAQANKRIADALEKIAGDKKP